jgi:hypothetical protein
MKPKAYLVGGGIGSLAAAACMIRDVGLPALLDEPYGSVECKQTCDDRRVFLRLAKSGPHFFFLFKGSPLPQGGECDFGERAIQVKD